ncbi:DUF1080 domain-containing protein [Paraflavisolibacter sp. H34]|uniref:3-keto-disaccharide hydrolase n=1 Tax=Huijunlia imazamoxiresistens TaxID=3127457 RepID=UPI00301B09ED
MRLNCTSALFLLCSLWLLPSCSSSRKAAGPSEKGFLALFDGKTLNGWEFDSTYWRMENGVLVGEITPQTIVKRNTFIIWKGGQPADFELKTSFRVSALGNSGINYRSVELDTLPYALKGYQADLDGRNRYNGQNYEERGRQFLARRGEQVIIDNSGKPVVTGSLGDSATLANVFKKEDWNDYHLVVKGNHMQHYLNGVLMSEVTDNDALNRKMSGRIGVQVHVGPPMKIEYRDMRLKEGR